MRFVGLTDHLSSAGLNLVNMDLGKECVKLEPSLNLSAAVIRLKETTTQLQQTLGQLSSDQLSQTTRLEILKCLRMCWWILPGSMRPITKGSFI